MIGVGRASARHWVESALPTLSCLQLLPKAAIDFTLKADIGLTGGTRPDPDAQCPDTGDAQQPFAQWWLGSSAGPSRHGGGTSAASRCMNARCDITRRVVPSRQGVLSLNTTCPAALHCARTLASAGRLIWRTRKSPRILRQMSGVLEETAIPGTLVSARGIAKLFLPIH
jgi:hypothetical protein